MEQTELKLEEYEEDGHLVVRAEMPGIDPEKDVEVTVTDRTLHIRAKRRSEKTTEDKKRCRSEFHYGSFSRSMRLPAGATEGDIRATYTDGVLEVRIPIDLVAEFASWVPLAMDRSSDGGFSIVVHLEAGHTWQYGFLLDGIRIVNDPRTVSEVNHAGDLVSVVWT